MEIKVKPGKYVVAVSGGVDSMVLLDLLAKQKNLELIVAHFDHGIRGDSDKDAKLVEQSSKEYDLPFELGYGQLGSKTSEATARQARYAFLGKIQKKYGADAIITAHHQDDLLETAFLNLLRGSGWRGLVAISRNPKIDRPLLNYNKKQIIAYASQKNLKWREDPTNYEDNFLRNQLRLTIMPKLSKNQREQFLKIIDQVATAAPQLEASLSRLPVVKNDELDRKAFAQLPSAIADELMLAWLKDNQVADIERQIVSRLSNAVKSAKASSRHDVRAGVWLKLDSKIAHLEGRGGKRLL